MNKTIIFFALITVFSIGYMLGYRKGHQRGNRGIDTQDSEYIEQYLLDHEEN